MTIEQPDEPEDDGQEAEVFSTGSWPDVSPLASLWGTNARLGERPDWATAAAFLTKAVERHRAAADGYARALLTDADIADLNSATVALEETIVTLGLARTMLASDPGPFPTIETEHESVSDHSAGDDIEWHIGFAESDVDRGFDDDDDNTDILPPFFELPVTIALGVALVDEAETVVRLRDAHVYRDGLLVTVDVAVRSTRDMSPEQGRRLDSRLWDVLDEDEPTSARDASRLISSSSRITARGGVAQWEYWVPRPELTTTGLRLRNPFSDGHEFWHVAVDGDLIDEARARVIDLRPMK